MNIKLGTIPVRRLIDDYREPPVEALIYIGAHILGGLATCAPAYYQIANDLPVQGWAVCLPAIAVLGAAFWASMGLRNDHILWEPEPDVADIMQALNDIPVPVKPKSVGESLTAMMQAAIDEWAIPATVVETFTKGKTLDVVYLQVKRGTNLNAKGLGANFSRDLRLPKGQVVSVEANAGDGRAAFYVPKAKRGMVTLADAAQHLTGPFQFTPGETVAAEYPVFDMRKMSHIGFFGETNSGKSVSLHATLLQLAAMTPPSLLRFVLVDPKRTEFSMYANLPHTMAGVAKDPREALNLMQRMVKIRKERQVILDNAGCRDLEGYNTKFPHAPLPYIVFAFDEMVELILCSEPLEEGKKRTIGAEIDLVFKGELSIARATGIRYYVGAQRLGSDDFSPLIRDNIPHFMAFATKSAGASGVATGVPGDARCTELLGNGDHICGLAKEIQERTQGVFVDEHIIEQTIKNIAK